MRCICSTSNKTLLRSMRTPKNTWKPSKRFMDTCKSFVRVAIFASHKTVGMLSISRSLASFLCCSVVNQFCTFHAFHLYQHPSLNHVHIYQVFTPHGLAVQSS